MMLTTRAAQKQLPPSPELGALSASFGKGEHNNKRLSIARYASFQAQTMSTTTTTSSLAMTALAGPHGIVVFETTKSQKPLLMLRQKVTRWNALQFSSQTKQLLLLAGALGSGVLVWDVSGNALDPLFGRLGHQDTVQDVDFKAANSITTCTDSSAFAWDLRQDYSRPSQRFGLSKEGAFPNVQVCTGDTADDNEVALLDRGGTVRVYDVRTSRGAISTFAAHSTLGVGLDRIAKHQYITWGIDNEHSVVKVWEATSPEEETSWSPTKQEDAESYWYMDGSSERSPLSSKRNMLLGGGYKQVAQQIFDDCTLACTRQCPDPYKAGIVTLSSKAKHGTKVSWKAELWKISSDGEDNNTSNPDFGLQRISSQDIDMTIGNDIWTSNSEKGLGSICAAELAVDTSNGDSGLLLTCLTTEGYVTCDEISKAKQLNPEEQPTTTTLSPSRRTALQMTRGGTTDPISAMAPPPLFRGVYTGSGVEPLVDPAQSLYSWTTEPAITHSISPQKQMRPNDNTTATSPQPQNQSIDDNMMTGLSRGVEGMMQFDMDVGFHEGIETVIMNAQQDVDVQQDQTVATAIQANRVPCPRLCSAVFGRDGLVCVHNGEIRKSWAWFEMKRGEKEPNMAYPRTLEDLIKMKAAAKEAQWGTDNDGTGSSEEESSVEDHLFDDDESSYDGSNSSLDDGDFFMVDKQRESSSDIYDSYFGDLTRPLASPGPSPPSSAINLKKSSWLGPTSDSLVPVVRVVMDDKEALFKNGQCPELAERWSLGDLSIVHEASVSSIVSREESADSTWGWDTSHHSEKGTYVVQFQELEKAASFAGNNLGYIATEPPTFAHTKSDTALKAKYVKDGNEETGDITVRGGEPGTRPNRKENMVFLSKFFNYQKIGSTSPTLFSPPDAPTIPKASSTWSRMKRSVSSNAIMESIRKVVEAVPSMEESSSVEEASDGTTSQRKFGVYTLSPTRYANVNAGWMIRTMQICFENARVCRELNQASKGHSWSLLGQMVDNALEASPDDALNGWTVDGALGRTLVANMLRHYEIQGDVQMLASIVCVLGCKQLKAEAISTSCLLPQVPAGTFDVYIRRYSESLYSWGLLTIRAQVNKHLVYKPLEEEQQIHDNKGPVKPNHPQMLSNIAKSSIIAFEPRCVPESQLSETSAGRQNSKLLTCAICCNAVRGLFTICVVCGHGGHVQHLIPWFKSNSLCPTGCGCNCVLVNSKPRTNNNPANLVMRPGHEYGNVLEAGETQSEYHSPMFVQRTAFPVVE